MMVKPKSDESAREGEPLSVSSLPRHGPILLSLAPLAYLVFVVARYAVDVPYWDEWELAPILQKSYMGQLTFGDLWAQHNEHRLFIPQLVMLGLARLTGWNIRYELEMNVFLGIGILGVLLWQMRATARRLEISNWTWAAPVCSLVVFSMSQFQNWLWGWQIQMMMNALAVVGGVVLLSNPEFSWRKFAAAAALGVVAAFSFANGLLFWPVGLGVLWLGARGKPERTPALAAWVGIGVLVVTAYFWHYQKPADHPPLALALQHPMAFGYYVFIYIGGICAQYFQWSFSSTLLLALGCGLAAIGVLGWSIHRLLRFRIATVEILLPYLGLSAYSLAGAVVTGFGRVGFGPSQALSSRYCTMMTPFWVSLTFLLFLLARGRPQPPRSDADSSPGTPARGKSAIAAAWLLAGAIGLLGCGSFFAIEGARQTSEVQSRGRTRLLELAEHPETANEDRGLSSLYPKPEVVLERYPFLLREHLSVFAEFR